MSSRNWNPLTRLLHWLGALLVVVCIGAVWAHESFDRTDPLRAWLMQLHFLLGGLIGATGLLRLATRLLTQPPVHEMPPLIARLARIGHLCLYLALLVLPVLGYLALSRKGVPVDLFGLLTLPVAPIEKQTGSLFKEMHELLANGLIALIGVHVAAAVYHAVVLRDEVLASMLGRANRQ